MRTVHHCPRVKWPSRGRGHICILQTVWLFKIRIHWKYTLVLSLTHFIKGSWAQWNFVQKIFVLAIILSSQSGEESTHDTTYAKLYPDMIYNFSERATKMLAIIDLWTYKSSVKLLADHNFKYIFIITSTQCCKKRLCSIFTGTLRSVRCKFIIAYWPDICFIGTRQKYLHKCIPQLRFIWLHCKHPDHVNVHLYICYIVCRELIRLVW